LEATINNLQGELFRTQAPPSALDDRTIASRFNQIDREIKDWIITYFKNTDQRVELSPELRGILIMKVPWFDKLLQQGKTRTLVIRAVAGHVLQKAFEDGSFVGAGEGMTALEKTMALNSMSTYLTIPILWKR
jgi:hypothetical protein